MRSNLKAPDISILDDNFWYLLSHLVYAKQHKSPAFQPYAQNPAVENHWTCAYHCRKVAMMRTVSTSTCDRCVLCFSHTRWRRYLRSLAKRRRTARRRRTYCTVSVASSWWRRRLVIWWWRRCCTVAVVGWRLCLAHCWCSVALFGCCAYPCCMYCDMTAAYPP